MQHFGGVECSTPFGITEGRHAHPLIKGAFLPRGAQRLSASRKVGTSSTSVSRIPRDSAQRLSASRKVGTEAYLVDIPRPVKVLNAFRHHGRSAHGSADIGTRLRYCAQRLSASRKVGTPMTSAISLAFRLCSTPFGITEGRHSAARLGPLNLRVCSTPFGITEGRHLLRSAEARLSPSSCAQRLSASRKVGTPLFLPT